MSADGQRPTNASISLRCFAQSPAVMARLRGASGHPCRRLDRGRNDRVSRSRMAKPTRQFRPRARHRGRLDCRALSVSFVILRPFDLSRGLERRRAHPRRANFHPTRETLRRTSPRFPQAHENFMRRTGNTGKADVPKTWRRDGRDGAGFRRPKPGSLTRMPQIELKEKSMF